MTQGAVLLHGAASSSSATWAGAGWADLLDDLAITTSYVPLPGHQGSPLAADAPASRVTAEILAADPGADVVLGFSAGAALALQAAAAAPERFRKIALLGFGDGMWTAPSTRAAIAERLTTRSDADNADVLLMRSMAASAGNDVQQVARFLATYPGPPPLESLRALTAEVLVVVGDRDSVGPADRLAAALGSARVVTLPGVDHYRTPHAPGAMAAVQGFLSG